METKMNIYQKLIEVRKSVPYLKKDNQGFQFKYVSSSQTLGSLRNAMDANQLLLVPHVIKWEIRDHTTRKGDHEYFTILDMEFTWINAEKPEETIICPWQGCGLDDGEKGTGKAVTYAEKYFLLKFFNIATDKDDPDGFQQKPKESPKQAQEPTGTRTGNSNSSEDVNTTHIKEIDQWLLQMSAGVPSDYFALLKRVSLYEKDGQERWLEKIDTLTGKPRWTNKIHHTTKEMYEAWLNTDASRKQSERQPAR